MKLSTSTLALLLAAAATSELAAAGRLGASPSVMIGRRLKEEEEVVAAEGNVTTAVEPMVEEIEPMADEGQMEMMDDKDSDKNEPTDQKPAQTADNEAVDDKDEKDDEKTAANNEKDNGDKNAAANEKENDDKNGDKTAAAEEEDDGTAKCGTCKKSDECLRGYVCASRTESGCFNFDDDTDKNMYCVEGPPTPMPTEMPTASPVTGNPTLTGAPTDVDDMEEVGETMIVNATNATLVNATVAGNATNGTAETTMEPTEAPTTGATSPEPTDAPVVATDEPTPSPTYGTVRWVGSNPEITLRLCEGDCDGDDDCEGTLVCQQRDDGEPIVGCGGWEDTEDDADYCVMPEVEEEDDEVVTVVASAQEAPSSGALRRTVGMVGLAIGATAAVFIGGF